jgi:hypothetical protein
MAGKRPWSEWVDEDLPEEADKGLKGQGASVEMMRRLKDAVNRLNCTTTVLMAVGIVLTLAILALTIVQVV